jgi:hypothetical protein
MKNKKSLKYLKTIDIWKDYILLAYKVVSLVIKTYLKNIQYW